MTRATITIRGELYVTLEAVASCYQVEVAWVEEAYELGLLGRGERVSGATAVEAAMLDRVLRMHLQQGVNLAGIVLLLGYGDFTRPRGGERSPGAFIASQDTRGWPRPTLDTTRRRRRMGMARWLPALLAARHQATDRVREPRDEAPERVEQPPLQARVRLHQRNRARAREAVLDPRLSSLDDQGVIDFDQGFQIGEREWIQVEAPYEQAAPVDGSHLRMQDRVTPFADGDAGREQPTI